MVTLSQLEIRKLILEALKELASDVLIKHQKHKKSKKQDKDNDKDTRDYRLDPLYFPEKDKYLFFDMELPENESEILELDATLDETGEPVCEGCLVAYMNEHKDLMLEAKYQGREVPLGKPMRGDVKKYRVFVRDPRTKKIKKVNFGDKHMEIKRDNPKRRKSFRARHKCSQAKDHTTAKYWSCRFWSKKPVSKMI